MITGGASFVGLLRIFQVGTDIMKSVVQSAAQNRVSV